MLREFLDVRSGQPADQAELDVLGRQVVEQPSPLPEQDWYDVQFELVELPGPQQRLRRPGPVHHHVAIPGRRAGLRGALAHIGDVADAARSRIVAPAEPVEEAEPAAARRLVCAVLRPGELAVQGHGHVQPDGRHRSGLRPHAVAQVLYTRPVQGTQQFELDEVGRHVLEQPAALPEQYGHQLQLHRVQ